MALNRIGNARFQRRLTRELRIDGVEPSPVLAPEVQPVVVLEAERPELTYLDREERFGGSLALGAVAGEYAYAFLVNPAESHALITVTDVFLAASGIAAYDLGNYNPTFVASLAGRLYDSLDQRVPQTATGQPGLAQFWMGTDPNTGGVVNNVVRLRVIANTMVHVRPMYVLPPGEGLGIFQDPVNTSFYGGVWWRERHAEDGELT
jgi:hypothetical protein